MLAGALFFACCLGPGSRRLVAEPVERSAVDEIPVLLSLAKARADWMEQRKQFEWRGAP